VCGDPDAHTDRIASCSAGPAVLAITLSAVLVCTAVLLAYAVRVARLGRATMPRLGASPGSALFPGWLMEAFYWALHAPGHGLVKLGISPDLLTYLSLLVSLASFPFAATGRFAYAAAAVLVGAALDALDGMVARAQRRASDAGAVLDSFVDRLADAAPLAGLAVFYRGHAWTMLLPIVAMVASSLVSYARAKADIYGLRLPNGLMRRHERVAYLSGSLLIAPIAPTLPLTGDVPYPLTLAGIALIAGIGFLAATLLVRRTRAALAEARVSRPLEAKRTPPSPPSPPPSTPSPATRAS
jgi:CDP-diacylglycerol--glycerol-3-phosphate 3-phosphatidyltransferase